MHIHFNRQGQTNVIYTAKNNYTNCHDFTRDVIVGLHDAQILNLRFPAADIAWIRNADMPQIAAWYDNLIANNPGNGNPPAQNNPITNGLIVFKVGTLVQHSMIVMQPHTWVGANNIGSLGNARAVPVDDTGVMLYNNMNQRNFVHGEIGGWNANGNIMQSLYGDNYTLHYIPFF